MEGKKERDIEDLKLNAEGPAARQGREALRRGRGVRKENQPETMGIPKMECPIPQGCGQTKSAGDFERDGRTKSGFSKYCKECLGRMNGSRRRPVAPLERGVNPASEKIKESGKVNQTITTKLPPTLVDQFKPLPLKIIPSLCIEVDFSQYPFLYEFIKSGQERYLRSPENMIIYAVKRFMDLADCRKGE